jgi:uncharacterized SAM-binding protein YcdF (DUF218 family)
VHIQDKQTYTYFHSLITLKQLRRIWKYVVVILTLAFFISVFIYRHSILGGIGHFLTVAESSAVTPSNQTFFVLGGNGYERGKGAALLAQEFPSAQFICTGAVDTLNEMRAMGMNLTSAQLTRKCMIETGVDSLRVFELGEATSTYEESEEILTYCINHNLKEISVVSSDFHLRRMSMVFGEKFEEKGILVHFFGTETKDFKAESWWTFEAGLITTFNEYIKIVYYVFKY